MIILVDSVRYLCVHLDPHICDITELFKTTFTPLYCVFVRPHIEYAMVAYFPNLTAEYDQMDKVHCLATRLVKGHGHVPHEEGLRKNKLFPFYHRLDFEGNVNPSDFFSRPSLPVWDDGVMGL